MISTVLTSDLKPLHHGVQAWHGETYALRWSHVAEKVKRHGGQLVSLWGSDETDLGKKLSVHVAYATPVGLICLTLPVGLHESYPDISSTFPEASRMQRAVRDLLGIEASRSTDNRPWLRHGAWSDREFPLRRYFDGRNVGTARRDKYPFVSVAGDGVHEIPVGPVHAGIIEPAHFRFHVVGERVLRLEERLGYKHKGIEKLFESMSLLQGVKLAGRVSGDSTVAYAWAYSMAVESASDTAPPTRASWIRGLLLERERIANHLGDLGALGNDAGFAFGLAQFSRLKEDLLRTNGSLFGHRYLMDLVVPGGVARDVDDGDIARLRKETYWLESEVRSLQKIYDEHAGLQDRFIKAGVVTRELADKLGACGLVARASGLAMDARLEMPCAPYDQIEVNMAVRPNGDVAARVMVRFDEILESLRLTRVMLENLPSGEYRVAINNAPEHAFGVGLVEGWRGEVFVALHTGPDGTIRRLHPHDPSWQNWPLLEHAVIGNIVPDFPLINKSFNLSYSGHDL
jgi:Ni,Fe-hydrogenase III large subunit/Ni,Fe-hydrogenase III component G